MANWFETKVRYDKTMENGAIKKVTEAYMVDALSFTEAEARISEEISHFTSEFSVSAVKRTKIAEIFRERTKLHSSLLTKRPLSRKNQSHRFSWLPIHSRRLSTTSWKA